MVSEEDLKNMSPEEIRELQKQNCIFCKIATKEIPAKMVYEDDIVCAFLDIQPKSMGHAIVVPKEHYVFFSQIPDDETKHIYKVIREISRSMLKAFQVKGTNMFMANGEAAGQFAPHVMIHLLPRYEGKDIPELHPVKEKYSESDLSKVQKALVSRIDEKLGTNMKQLLSSTTQDDNKSEGSEKNEEASTNNPDDAIEAESEGKTPKEDNSKSENKGAEKKRDKSGDIDLDKISDLFK